jgi:ligand-binding sensor domain-containing protein
MYREPSDFGREATAGASSRKGPISPRFGCRLAYRSAMAASFASLVACAAVPGGSSGAAGAPAPSASPREDRVLLTAFDVIPAVAVSRHTVYVASVDGVAALDRDFGRWLPPVAFGPGFAAAGATVMAADPVEEGVWIATAGSVLYYRPSLGDIARGIAPGGVDAIVFDERNPGAGAFLHGAAGWALATRTGMVSPVDPSRVPPAAARSRPSSLAEVYAKYPSLRGAGALLTRDADLQSWPVMSGAIAPDRSEVWLGTAGGGLFRVDPLFMKGEQLPFGPLQTATGALARDSDGVWMAGVGAAAATARSGLAHASEDLQRWRWLASPALSRALGGGRALRMSVRGSRLWVATDRGLVSLDASEAGHALRWTATSGLPDDRALSVAASDAGAWVGTARGLAFVGSDASARAARATDVRVIGGVSAAVRALVLAGDTLWVGSDAGVLLLRGASPDSALRTLAVDDARLSRPVMALAKSDSVVAAATDRDLLVILPSSASIISRFDAVDVAAIAPVSAMAMDASTIWLAGRGGVLVVARANGASRLRPAPGPIPAQALDVALDPNYAWVATPAGVVRLRRASDGGVR